MTAAGIKKGERKSNLGLNNAYVFNLFLGYFCFFAILYFYIF